MTPSSVRPLPPRSRWAALAGSLFWRVLGLNAALSIAAAVILALSPLTISSPVTSRQAILLALGLGVMLVANALLLRVSLRPLRALSLVMERIDLLRPGARLQPAGARELVSVTEAFNRMLERLEHERRLSTFRAVGGHEEELRRLAAELHDEVGQSLTALLLMLRPALQEAPEEFVPSLEAIQAVARDTLDEVRRIARSLRPTVLDDLGLASALETLCGVMEQTTDILVNLELDDTLPAPSKDVELALYRIAQEALTNVARHAAASEATVELVRDGESLVLRVSDNGRGMLYAADVEGGGIRGMRGRALAIGAAVGVSSRPGGGTVVSVTVTGVPA